jgi:hypothetical protein
MYIYLVISEDIIWHTVITYIHAAAIVNVGYD